MVMVTVHCELDSVGFCPVGTQLKKYHVFDLQHGFCLIIQ